MHWKKFLLLMTSFAVITALLTTFCQKKKSPSPSDLDCVTNSTDIRCMTAQDCNVNPNAYSCIPPPYCETHSDSPDCQPLPPFECKKGVNVGTSPTNWRFQCLTGMQVEDQKRTQVCCIEQNLADLDAGSDEYGKHRNFSGSIFDGSILSGANFTYAILDKASLRDTKIATANFPGNFSTNFYRASCKQTDFSGAEIGTGKEVRFDATDLTNTKFDHATFGKVIFQNAILNGTQFGGEVNFKGSASVGVEFLGSTLNNVNFGNGNGEILSSLDKVNLQFVSTNTPIILNDLRLNFKKLVGVKFSGTPSIPMQIQAGNLVFDSNAEEIYLERVIFSFIEGNGKIIFKKRLNVGVGVDFGNLGIFECREGCDGINCPSSCRAGGVR